MAASTVHDKVTARIVAALEKGVAPWVRPWSNRYAGMRYQPHNLSTGRDYAGVNVLSLGCEQEERGFACGAWATYKQIADMGGQVRKGEKGTEIVYYETWNKKGTDPATGEETEQRIPMLKTFYVFNLEQADGLDVGAIAEANWQPVPEAEATLRNSGAVIRHGGNKAFYRRAPHDFIQLPEPADFPTAGNYYATAFHELTHWTGDDQRTPREKGKAFGDSVYAFEELIAELGAAFLCSRHGIDGELQHAAYIDHWLKVLQEDNRAIFRAAAAAQRAVDYVMTAAAQPQQVAA